MTETAASSSVAATVSAAGTATPSWSEEFSSLNLAPGQLWYANPNNPSGQTGVKDPAGHTWDAHPAQKFTNGVQLNPFTIGPVTDASGAASDGNCLTVTLKNSSSSEQSACGYAAWGGTIVTNADVKVFTVGCYTEWRALFRGTGTNLWPALWYFAAAGVHAGQVNAADFQGAEVDLVEPEGNPSPGWVSMHMRMSGDAPNPKYQYKGSSDINGANFYGYPIVQNTWAVYGFDWQTTGLTYYLNGVAVAHMTDPVVLSYFNQAKMALRIDYTLQSASLAGGSPVSVSIDNIRQWSSFAASRASAPLPPQPQPPTIVTTALPGATQGVAYSTTLIAQGGVVPLTWTSSGSLPAGLTLTPGGVISGTPSSTAASSTFSVACTGNDGAVATRSLSIAVSAPTPPPPPSTTTLTVTIPVDPTDGMTAGVEALLVARGYGASSLTVPLSTSLANFQTAKGITPSGNLDAATWTALITG